MTGKWEKKEFRISDLSLWDENARFPDKYFSKTEEDLIDFFLQKRDFKIKTLASEIVSEFDIPQLEKIVVLSIKNKNVVIEGNRRLVVYKLLAKPSLVKDSEVQSFFDNLSKKIKLQNNFKLEALVTEQREEAMRPIYRKHYLNNNEVGWGEQERANHSARRGADDKKVRLRVAVSERIKDLDIPEQMKETVLGPGFVTTFYRILTSSPAAKEYKFSFRDESFNIGDTEFDDKLKVIITNVLQKKDFKGNTLDSRTLNTNNAIEQYIKSIDETDYTKVAEEITSMTTKNIFGEDAIELSPSKKGRRTLPSSDTRTYLIPRTCNLVIRQQKINNIYHELREKLIINDSASSVPNATGVLFRVFLESTLDHFLIQHNIPVDHNDTVQSKATKVADLLVRLMKANESQLRNLRKVASSNPENSLLAIENFHEFVHSLKVQPRATDLKRMWDDLQEFFEIVWHYLNNKYAESKNKND